MINIMLSEVQGNLPNFTERGAHNSPLMIQHKKEVLFR